MEEESPSLQPRQSALKSVMISPSTDIACNTGNGSKGFVFVTANAQPPILVAAGNEGSRVIPWIRSGNYVFGLFGDAERRTLLSTVTVSGVATELSHGQLRWLLFAVLLAVLYAALYLSSTGRGADEISP